MAKGSKVLIALSGIIAGIIIGVFWVNFNQQDFISEADARELVTELYGGTVDSVSTSENNRYFVINLEGTSATHSITVDREDSSVEGIETISRKEDSEVPPEEEPDKKVEEAAKEKEEPAAEPAEEKVKKPAEKSKEAAQQTKLTVEEATDIAVTEVGGMTVYTTWSGDENAREYYILQLLNDEDDGALVSINGITGNVNKVIWLEVDEDDDYEEVEQLIYEATEYGNLYDNRYIEFDDEYFED